MSNEQTRYTCPDCGGAIERIRDGNVIQFRCRVGHLYSPLTALNVHHDREENTVWSAAVVVAEGAEMAEELAGLEDGKLAERLLKVRDAKRLLVSRIEEIAREFPIRLRRGSSSPVTDPTILYSRLGFQDRFRRHSLFIRQR